MEQAPSAARATSATAIRCRLRRWRWRSTPTPSCSAPSATGNTTRWTASLRPEQAILGLRKELGLFANLRPAHAAIDELAAASSAEARGGRGTRHPDRPRTHRRHLFRRAARRRAQHDGRRGAEGFDTMRYTEAEIERIARVAFQRGAQARQQALLGGQGQRAGDLAVLARSRHRRPCRSIPTSTLDHMYVDNAAMQLVREPAAVRRDRHRQHVRRHPVGRGRDADRLHRHAAVGLAGRQRQGPLRADPRLRARHRRARIANPLATILSLAMMLRSLLRTRRVRPQRIEAAVQRVLARACAPPTSRRKATTMVGTRAMGDAVVAALSAASAASIFVMRAMASMFCNHRRTTAAAVFLPSAFADNRAPSPRSRRIRPDQPHATASSRERQVRMITGRAKMRTWQRCAQVSSVGAAWSAPC